MVIMLNTVDINANTVEVMSNKDKVIKNNIKLNKLIAEGLYIPTIEACWIYKENIEKNDYVVEEKYLDKLLKGKFDYCFELFENTDLLNVIDIREYQGKYYTLDIINMKYEKKYKDEDSELNTGELRDWTYKEEGFKFNSTQMINFKRGGGKARNAQNLFISKFSDDILKWGRMGLKFTEPTSIASVRAYESLPLSAIFTYVRVKPSEILIVDDYKSKFSYKMADTWLEDGKLYTENQPVTESNSIWDGEGLCEVSVIDTNEKINGKGVILTRQRQMKAAFFACYISKCFKKYFGKDYDTAKVPDMYNNLLNAKDIKLITTPSAIKISKNNADIIREYPKYSEYGDGAWLQYWKDNAVREDGYIYLGVCKTEKPSHNCVFAEDGTVLTYRNVLSYQQINTIFFKDKKDIADLLQSEIDHINRLKNDLDYFLKEVKAISETDLSKELEYDEETIEEDEVGVGLNIDITGAFLELVQKNPNFTKTQVFKDYKRNYIAGYIRQLRKGKMHVDNTDYSIVCGNCIELLKQALGIFDETCELGKYEIYSSRLKDGQKVACARNPHVVHSNWLILTNKVVDDIKEYMRCTDNIVYISSINQPILSVFSGMDFDIDCILMSENQNIIDNVKRLDVDRFLITHNSVEPSRNDNKLITGQNMSDTDKIIANNYIGDVINLSQEINSKINDYMYKLNNNIITDIEKIQYTNNEIDRLFKLSSRLNSCSNVEIDKAKKTFLTLNIPKELEEIKLEFKKVSEDDSRRIKPYFFKFAGDNKTMKKRKKTNKKHRKELNEQTIINYCKEKEIDIKTIDKRSNEIKELLKTNEKIQEEWENAIYDKTIETPMNWLNILIDEKISNTNRKATIQIISLVKVDKNKANGDVVDYIVNCIKNTDTKIKSYKGDDELDGIERLEKIKDAKRYCIQNIKDVKTHKAEIYWVLRKCLNSVAKNGKVKTKSGIESLALELLFCALGDQMLKMFI